MYGVKCVKYTYACLHVVNSDEYTVPIIIDVCIDIDIQRVILGVICLFITVAVVPCSLDLDLYWVWSAGKSLYISI